jgi:hypothetical protein
MKVKTKRLLKNGLMDLNLMQVDPMYDKIKFKQDNYIPSGLSLEFKDFETFYERSKSFLGR